MIPFANLVSRLVPQYMGMISEELSAAYSSTSLLTASRPKSSLNLIAMLASFTGDFNLVLTIIAGDASNSVASAQTIRNKETRSLNKRS